VSCAVRSISEAAGQLPLHIYKKLPNGGKELALDHPLYRLLHDAPNGWTPSSLFRSQITADSLLQPYGGFAQIVRADGKPFEIIRLDPRLSSVVVDYSNFEPQYIIKADGKNPARKILPADIIHLASPAYDQTRGLVGENKEAIALAMVLERHASRLFGNAARPSGVLSLKGNPSPVAVANAKASWQTSQAADKAGGTAVVPADASWTPLTFNSVDAQFMEARAFQIREVAKIFRVPAHMLMETDRSTPRSIESLGQAFIEQSLMPHLIKWEQALELKLLSPEERDEYTIQFNLDGFARADLLARAQAVNLLISARATNPNEARSLYLGLPGYGPTGDVFENPNTSSAHAGGKLNAPTSDDSEVAQ
jgi:HK97 family phage portal protein